MKSEEWALDLTYLNKPHYPLKLQPLLVSVLQNFNIFISMTVKPLVQETEIILITKHH